MVSWLPEGRVGKHLAFTAHMLYLAKSYYIAEEYMAALFSNRDILYTAVFNSPSSELQMNKEIISF